MKKREFKQEKQKNWPVQQTMSRHSIRMSRQPAKVCRNKDQAKRKPEMKTVAT